MGLTLEQKTELIDIYHRVKTGASDSIETTGRMVILHNEIYGTRYKPGTRCNSCLSGILRNIKKLYEENKD